MSHDEVRQSVVIINQRGLHARAASKFVKLVTEYNVDIKVVKDATIVSGKSILGLMMLAAGPGTEIELIAQGQQAAVALDALIELIQNKFEEEN